MNASFTLDELNADGTRTMNVNGREYLVSAQSLSDDVWSMKLQQKANLFASNEVQ